MAAPAECAAPNRHDLSHQNSRQAGRSSPPPWDPQESNESEQGLDEWDDLCSQLDSTSTSFQAGPHATFPHDGRSQRQQCQPGCDTVHETLRSISTMLARNQRAQSLHGRATTLLARQVLDCLRGTQVHALAKAVQGVRECADWAQQVHQLNTELKVQRYSWEQVHSRLMEAQAALHGREEELLARDQDLCLLRTELEVARSQSSRSEAQRCLVEARTQEVAKLQADLLARDQECARLKALVAAAAGPPSTGGTPRAGRKGCASPGMQLAAASTAADAAHAGPGAAAGSAAACGRGQSECSADEHWTQSLMQRLQVVVSSAAVAAPLPEAADGPAVPEPDARGRAEAGVSKVEQCVKALVLKVQAGAEAASKAEEQQWALRREAADARKRGLKAEAALAEAKSELGHARERERGLGAELAAAQARLEAGEARLATATAREKQLEADLVTAQAQEQSIQATLVAEWEQAAQAKALAAAESKRAGQATAMLEEAEGKLAEVQVKLAEAEGKLVALGESKQHLAGQLAGAVARLTAMQQQDERWAAAAAAAEARARAAEAAQAAEGELAASLRARLESKVEAHARQVLEAEASKRELTEGLRERQAQLQAKLEEAEQRLRSAPAELQQQQQQQLSAAQHAATQAQDALAAERELSESLSQELGKTQARLAALQQEHGALKREALLLADRASVSEEGLEAARQEAEDAAAAARREADTLRRELCAAEVRRRSLQAATEAGERGVRGSRRGHQPRVSWNGDAGASWLDGLTEAPATAPMPAPKAVRSGARGGGGGGSGAAAAAAGSGVGNGASADDGGAGAAGSALREAQGLVAALEQELELTRSKLQALTAAGQAECAEVLRGCSGGPAAAVGAAGGGSEVVGLHALLGALRCCEVQHTRHSAHGSSLDKIRVLQAQLENVLQTGLAGTGRPPALLQELRHLRDLQQQQQQQRQQRFQDEASERCDPSDSLQQQSDPLDSASAGPELSKQQQQQEEQRQQGLWQVGGLTDLSLLEELNGWGDGGEAESGSWMRVDAAGGGWGDVSSEAGRSDLTSVLSSSYEGAEQPTRDASNGSFRLGPATDSGGGSAWDRRPRAAEGGSEFRFGSGGGAARRGGLSDDVMAGLDAWDLPPLTPPPRFD